MNKAVISIHVFFEEPFWIGLCERIENGHLSVCKITFGSEPKDCEVKEYLLHHWHQLSFSPAVEFSAAGGRKINPKRMQREINKQLYNLSIGTKAQQAMQLQYEAMKAARKERCKKQKKEDTERKFSIKQQKRKEKHRGH